MISEISLIKTQWLQSPLEKRLKYICLDRMFFMKERSVVFYIIHVLAPLAIGCLIYYVFCPDVYFVDVIDRIVGCGFHIKITTDYLFVKLIRFYIFDVLWAYSLTFAVFGIAGCMFYREILLTGIIGFEILMESLQTVPAIPGTFDIWDMVLEVVTSVILFNIYYSKENYRR